MNARRAVTVTAVLGSAALVTLGGLSGRITVPAAASAAPALAAPAAAALVAPTMTASAAPAAVKAFDEAGVSTGTGDNFTQAQWAKIRKAGFRLFITDPIKWSSECSNGTCSKPVDTCTVDKAAVTQIRDAENAGVDYAVYTRNVKCLTAAIKGLGSSLRQHLSFAVLDIETDPSVPPSAALVNGVKALSVTPVFYSYQSAWKSITGNTKAYDHDALLDGEVPNFNVSFPAKHPAGFPKLVRMPHTYGGWNGYAALEQQQCCTDLAGIDNSSDQADLDAVNAAWLATLPHAERAGA
jgi:hypothetical protein